MDDDDETYILLLLSDSNLPTGSFVASSGLESYIKHGFMTSPTSTIVTFLQDSLGAYARSALPFVTDAHHVVERLRTREKDGGIETGDMRECQDKALEDLAALDDLYDTMTLNHVARRASKSQGVALLTLYSKGFSRPSSSSVISGAEGCDQNRCMSDLLEKFKLMARKEDTQAHLPICWGVLTAALGLALERSQYLHLFLHARSLLSASVRLNDMGPYSAQQLLMHVVRPLVASQLARCKDLRTGLLEDSEVDFDEKILGPANTWPLGEILAARHDLQHSRIFNS
ncbi:putative ureF [Lyophyllum shimeji]|uniref:UreF n=1 Tax=Lyophyllum shimeji TaxID=47721 RepID=A0A9P3PEN8_LYOSH|nr:putative ureF [Lyophyllum shimeji]